MAGATHFLCGKSRFVCKFLPIIRKDFPLPNEAHGLKHPPALTCLPERGGMVFLSTDRHVIPSGDPLRNHCLEGKSGNGIGAKDMLLSRKTYRPPRKSF